MTRSRGEVGSRCLNAAMEMRDRGYDPIPIEAGGKTPLVAWKEYQERQATEEEVAGWFTKWPDANLAIVTGSASGVDVIDFDTDAAGRVTP